MKLVIKALFFLLLCTQSVQAVEYEKVMSQLIAKGDDLSERYQPERAIGFGNGFSALYFGGFEGEGLEFAVGQADSNYMINIELLFSRLISQAVKGAKKEVVQERWQALRLQLINAPMIAEDSANAEIVFQAFIILLREGVEALLVIAALLAYLRRSGAADRIPLVWAGTVVALVASALTAWGLQVLIKNTGALRETIEGVSILLAAVLLSYVSFWLFSKREAAVWQRFVANSLEQAVDKGSLSAIVGVAFFAVYREGAETILFYQALLANAQDQWQPMLMGAGLAVLALAAFYVLIFMLSVKLPLKLFFTLSAALLFSMSVTFVGKGVLELQVSGWLSTTAIDFVPTVSWLGLFPSAESVLAQLLFLILPTALYLLAGLKRSVVVSIG